MAKLFKKSGFFVNVAFAGLMLLMSSPQAHKEDEFALDTYSTEQQSAQKIMDYRTKEIMDYWTRQRMDAAIPTPLPVVIVDDVEMGVDFAVLDSAIDANPGYAPGWAPGSGPQPADDAAVVITSDHPLYEQATAEPGHSWSLPTSPRDGPWPPFQRWTWFGEYLNYPTSLHGVLFYTHNGVDMFCSGTVIHRSAVLTAGHCLSTGGTLHTNFMFCPSYNENGVNPAVGCWTNARAPIIATGWHADADADYDYGCMVTNTFGTVHDNAIGNVTGWAGRAWNFSSSQMTFRFGYPGENPFPGDHLIAVAAPEAYEFHFTAGGQASKFTGSDMTRGCSGGSWILGLSHASAEYEDTDGSLSTDPLGTSVNGVNSHWRCSTDCSYPPTTSNGRFWQAMSSPPFRMTDNDDDESEDIIRVCLDVGGTDE